MSRTVTTAIYTAVLTTDAKDMASSLLLSSSASLTPTVDDDSDHEEEPSTGDDRRQSTLSWLIPLAVSYLLVMIVTVFLSFLRFTYSSSATSFLPFSAPSSSPLSASTPPLVRFDTDYIARLSHIPLLSVCDGRYWDTLISVLLSIDQQQIDDETARIPGSPPSSSSTEGYRRLYSALLKVLCGHPVLVGVSGTSVSAGHGVDYDSHRVYAYMVWEWLQKVPLLPQASSVYHSKKMSHGYRNAAVLGVGSDFASVCLSGTWSTTTGILNNVIWPDVDPSPDPAALTAAQLAWMQGRDAVLPDLLFIEYLANDFHFVATGSDIFSWAKEADNSQQTTGRQQKKAEEEGREVEETGVDFGNAATNMQRLLSSALAHSATAPILINTFWANDTALSTIEEVYHTATDMYGIPVVSWYRRFYDDATYGRSGEAAPIASTVRNHLLVDGVHLNDAGHLDLALHIIIQLQKKLHRIITTIHTYMPEERNTAVVMTADHLSPVTSSIFSEVTGDNYCSISFSFAQLAVNFFQHPLHHYHFTYNNDTTKTHWFSSTSDAHLVYDLRSFLPSLSPSSSIPIDTVSVAFVKSWSAEFGAALVWVEADVTISVVATDGTRVTGGRMSVNASVPHVFEAHWSLPQSTTVVKKLPFRSGRSLLKEATGVSETGVVEGAECVKGSGCVVVLDYWRLWLHVRNAVEGKKFQFTGVFAHTTR
jgi:hypothetical protein